MRIPWWIPPLSGNESIGIQSVLTSGFINDGNVVEKVENKLALVTGARNVICTPSGTAAITLLLLGLNLKKNSRIGVSNMTFIATANAAAVLGYEVVLIDVDPISGFLNLNDLSQKIIGLDLVIITHISGRNCLTNDLIDLLTNAGVPFIEDSAEALGSKHSDGKNLGLRGVGGTFSFSPNKILTSGQGGFIATDSDELAIKLRSIKNQGRRGKSSGGDDEHQDIGWNFKWTNIQASMIDSQLPQLNSRLDKLRRIENMYNSILRNSKNVFLNVFGKEESTVYLWPEIQSIFRTELTKLLEKHEIGFRRMWFPLNTQAPFKQDNKKFLGSQEFSNRSLWLASSLTISEIDFEYIRENFGQIIQEVDAL